MVLGDVLAVTLSVENVPQSLVGSDGASP